MSSKATRQLFADLEKIEKVRGVGDEPPKDYGEVSVLEHSRWMAELDDSIKVEQAKEWLQRHPEQRDVRSNRAGFVSLIDGAAEQAEMQRALDKYLAKTKEVTKSEEAVASRAKVWLSYSLEKKAAQGGSDAGRRSRVQQWIKRMTAASKMHKEAECVARKGTNVCVFCSKLAADFKSAISMKRQLPIVEIKKDRVGTERLKPKSRSEKKVEKLSGGQVVAKPVDGMWRRADVKQLEVPTVATSGSYKQYLVDYEAYIVFRASVEKMLGEREERAFKPKPVVEEVVEVKSEAEVAVAAKAKLEAKKAKKVRKNFARKLRKLSRANEEKTVVLKGAKLDEAIAKVERKKIEAAARSTSVEKKKEGQSGPIQESDVSSTKKKRIANQKKRLRKKRSAAAKLQDADVK